jgi:hypothetical protein
VSDRYGPRWFFWTILILTVAALAFGLGRMVWLHYVDPPWPR